MKTIFPTKTLWFTGLSGAGKTTLANGLQGRLRASAIISVVLDGDRVRRGLSADLSYSEDDRLRQTIRVAYIAKLLNEQHITTIVSLISPLRHHRLEAKKIIGVEHYCEVYINASLQTCRARDVKGLYASAADGNLVGLTGIDSPYEPPSCPDLTLCTDLSSAERDIERLYKFLSDHHSKAPPQRIANIILQDSL